MKTTGVLAAAAVLFVVAAAGVGRGGEAGPVDADAGLRERGRGIYEAVCAPCHGVRGDGRGSAARWLDPPPRDFTRGDYKLRSTDSGALPTDDDLLHVIDVGVPGTAMPAWKQQLSVDERRAVIAYVKTLSPRFAKAKRPPVARPAVARPAGVSDADLRAEGEKFYVLLGCWNCHGRGGRGDGPAAPTLHDDVGRRIRAADFVYGPLRAGGTPEAVVRVLDTGMNGTPMPSFTDGVLVAREVFAQLPADAGLDPATRANLSAWATVLPAQAEIDALDDDARQALAARRLWALAIYVVSLRAPASVTDWLLVDRPGAL